MKDKKYIVLDLGNVCISVDPLNFFRALGERERMPDEYLEHQRAFECGKLSEEQFFDFAKRMFDGRHSIEKLKSAYRSIVKQEISGMAQWLEERKAGGFEIVMFSDTSPIHLEDVASKLSFYEKFDHRVVSFEVGVQKPQSAMYEAVEKICGGIPFMFVDDKLCNIEAAEKRGWPVFHFTN